MAIQDQDNATTTTPTSTTEEDAKITALLNSFPHDPPAASLIHIPRFRQRLSILSAWSIAPGSRVLDIGCGQGDSSLALALELGPDSHITGIDSAPPSYGTPLTISESQEKILHSPFGSRLAFYNEVDVAGLFKFLNPTKEVAKFDAAAACHSLFYFPSHSAVTSLFSTLSSQGIKKVYVAEYDQQHTTFPTIQTPHVLAAKAQALYFAYKAEADAKHSASKESHNRSGTQEHPVNIRTAPKIASIISAAEEAGYDLKRKGKFTPAEEYQEGRNKA